MSRSVRFSLREHKDFGKIYSTAAITLASASGYNINSVVDKVNNQLQHMYASIPYIEYDRRKKEIDERNEEVREMGSREDAVKRYLTMMKKETEEKEETE